MFKNVSFIQNQFQQRVTYKQAKLEVLSDMWEKVAKKLTSMAMEKQD